MSAKHDVHFKYKIVTDLGFVFCGVALTKSQFLQSVALNKILQKWVGKGNESNVLGHGNIIFVQT